MIGKIVNIIDKLRERVPGTWRYNKRAQMWFRDEGGYAMYSCTVGAGGDLGEPRHLFYYPKNGEPLHIL